MSKKNSKNISMWASPRSISTAMMYSFAQRKDCAVIDEPFYAYYLENSPAKDYHPGASEILESMSQDAQEIIEEMTSTSKQKPIYFYKNMSHHLIGLDFGFFEDLEHIILTRDPKLMIRSFQKVIQKPSLTDTGYKSQVAVLNYLLEIGKTPIVIESNEFLMNPKQQLKILCERLEIPFTEQMLHWKKGRIPEDGIWAKYWYNSVHNSTGFGEAKRDDFELPESLLPLYQDCLSYYKQLIPYKITT